MKRNRIPAKVRLKNRITQMEVAEEAIWVSKKYYPYCRHCNITNVHLSIAGDHYQGCPFRGWAKQIQHYKYLLQQLEGT